MHLHKLLLILFFICACGANNKLQANNSLPQIQIESYQIGDSIWINHLCMKITESNQLEIVDPISDAISSCSKLKNYTEVEKAYTNRSLLKCSDMDLKNEKINTVCETSNGWKFKKVEAGIKDMASELILMIEIKDFMGKGVIAAIGDCADKGLRLPTAEELKTLSSRKYTEAFNDDMYGKHIFTSNIGNYYHSLDRIEEIKTLVAESGVYIDYESRFYGSSYNQAVRCVKSNM